jgi:uncharacterized OB-fold protein
LNTGGKKAQDKVCPKGHVMHPSWDQCPYCLADEVIEPIEPRGASGEKRK